MSSFLFRSVIPRPHAAHEVAGLGPDRGGVDRGCRERGVSEDGRDRGERDASGNCGDAVAVAKAPGARLRALDAGRSHDRAHLAVRRLPGDGPKGPGRAPRASLEPSQPMHELEGVHEVLGDRNGPPVVRPALQVRDSEFARLEVDIARADPERLGHPAPGHREGARQGLDARSRVRAGRGEEALALRPGEIFPAACVDQGERAVGHEPEKLHYFMSNDQASGRPPLPAALQRPLPARPWLRGVPKRDRMCILEHAATRARATAPRHVLHPAAAASRIAFRSARLGIGPVARPSRTIRSWELYVEALQVSFASSLQAFLSS